MRNISIKFLLSVIACYLVSPAFIMADADFRKGKIIEKVTCQHDPGENYALYLPSTYTPEKKWPVLFAFDPAGRGVVPLQYFEQPAETFGYIIICPYNSKNGPNEPVVKAMNAIWQDSLARFSINKDRIYATGFSGGARVSSFFPLVINNPLQGIIACGAGLATSLRPEQLKLTNYYGIVGVHDFNYLEMLDLHKVLEKAGITYHIAVFDGTHNWPPKELCLRAVQWLEVLAMKQQKKEKDPAFIEQFYNDELARAQEFERKGDLFFASNTYESMMTVFKDLKDLAEVQEKHSQLLQNKAFKKFQKEEEKRKKEETETLQQIMGIFAYIIKKNPDMSELNTILSGLKVKEYLKKSQGKDTYESGIYSRLLATMGSRANEQGVNYLSKEDYTKAVIFFEIAALARKNTPWGRYDLYDLACSYIKYKNNKKALKSLREAVEAGFLNKAYMEKDKDLDPLRQLPEYKKIIELIDLKASGSNT